MKKVILMYLFFVVSCSSDKEDVNCDLKKLEIMEQYSELIIKASNQQRLTLIRNRDDKIKKLNCY